MLKAVGLTEIERIFAVTDALGISREALVIPLPIVPTRPLSAYKIGERS